MRSKTVRVFALAASVAFAACGASTDLVMDELSEVEAQDLAGTLLQATFTTTSEFPSAVAGGPQAVPYESNYDSEGTIECPLGGSVDYDASLTVSGDTESQASTVGYSMTQTHQACRVTSEGGREFTLTGAPSLTLEFLVASNGQGVVEWSGSVEGTVEWMTDDRAGSCLADFEFGGRQEAGVSFTGELAGSVCGHSVQQSFSVGD